MHRLLACPTHLQQRMRYKMRPGHLTRSPNDKLLFAQCNGAWIDRLVLIVRHIVDHHDTVAIQRNGVADDLAVQPICPAVAVDADRRPHRQDRSGHLAGCVAVDSDIFRIGRFHVEQQAFVISSGRSIDPVVWISVPGYVSGGKEEGHVVAIDTAVPTQVDAAAAVDVNLKIVAGQRTAGELQVATLEEELGVIGRDILSINRQTAVKAVRARTKDHIRTKAEIEVTMIAGGDDDPPC